MDLQYLLTRLDFSDHIIRHVDDSTFNQLHAVSRPVFCALHAHPRWSQRLKDVTNTEKQTRCRARYLWAKLLITGRTDKHRITWDVKKDGSLQFISISKLKKYLTTSELFGPWHSLLDPKSILYLLRSFTWLSTKYWRSQYSDPVKAGTVKIYSGRKQKLLDAYIILHNFNETWVVELTSISKKGKVQAKGAWRIASGSIGEIGWFNFKSQKEPYKSALFHLFSYFGNLVRNILRKRGFYASDELNSFSLPRHAKMSLNIDIEYRPGLSEDEFSSLDEDLG